MNESHGENNCNYNVMTYEWTWIWTANKKAAHFLARLYAPTHTRAQCLSKSQYGCVNFTSRTMQMTPILNGLIEVLRHAWTLIICIQMSFIQIHKNHLLAISIADRSISKDHPRVPSHSMPSFHSYCTPMNQTWIMIMEKILHFSRIYLGIYPQPIAWQTIVDFVSRCESRNSAMSSGIVPLIASPNLKRTNDFGVTRLYPARIAHTELDRDARMARRVFAALDMILTAEFLCFFSNYPVNRKRRFFSYYYYLSGIPTEFYRTEKSS